MFGRQVINALILSGCLCFLPFETSRAQQSLGNPIGGAILLENDGVLVGDVFPNGQFLTVESGPNSRVSIPAARSKFVGKDVSELYRFKVEKVGRWKAGDHFQLTRWCLKNGLYPEAVTHYRYVQKDYPNHRSVKQLAIELQNKLLELPEFRTHLGLPPVPDNKTQLASRSLDPAQTESPDKSEGSASSAVVTASGSMDTTVMHPEIAAQFSRRIQPILLNRCSQAACHGTQSQNDLRVIEPYRSAYERVSAENLKSVMAHVSTEPKRLSDLLRYATTAHGIQRQAGISVTETELLSELTKWIEMIHNPVKSAVAHSPANSGNAVMPAIGQKFTPYSPAVQLVPVKPGASGLKPVPRLRPNPYVEAENAARNAAFPAGDMPLESEIDALDRQLRQVLGEPPAPANRAASQVGPSRFPAPKPSMPKSTDPFDPAEFNRMPN